MKRANRGWQSYSDRVASPAIINTIIVFGLVAATTLIALCYDLRLSRYMTLSYAVIICCGIWLCRRSLPLGILFMYAGTVCAMHWTTSILAAISILIYAIIFIFIISQKVKSGWVYNTICIIAILNVIYQLLQLAGIQTYPGPSITGHHTLVGLQGNVNEASVFMAISLPAFFRKRWMWCLPLPIAGLVMAESLSGVMAVFAAVLVYIFLQEKARVVISIMLASLLVAAGIFYAIYVDKFSYESQKNSRLTIWKESITAALYKPIFGWGFGQYSAVIPLITNPMAIPLQERKALYTEVEDKKAFNEVVNKMAGANIAAYYKNKKYPASIFLEAHNEYIETLFASGIAGLLLLLSSIAHILREGWKKKDRLPFYGFLVSCVTATVFFSWQIVPIAVITVVWGGLCLRSGAWIKRG